MKHNCNLYPTMLCDWCEETLCLNCYKQHDWNYKQFGKCGGN